MTRDAKPPSTRVFLFAVALMTGCLIYQLLINIQSDSVVSPDTIALSSLSSLNSLDHNLSSNSSVGFEELQTEIDPLLLPVQIDDSTLSKPRALLQAEKDGMLIEEAIVITDDNDTTPSVEQTQQLPLFEVRGQGHILTTRFINSTDSGDGLLSLLVSWFHHQAHQNRHVIKSVKTFFADIVAVPNDDDSGITNNKSWPHVLLYYNCIGLLMFASVAYLALPCTIVLLNIFDTIVRIELTLLSPVLVIVLLQTLIKKTS